MSDKSNKPQTFSEIMEQLDQLMAGFDESELDIEKALRVHAEATLLLDELEKRLAAAKAKAEAQLRKKDD